MTDYIPTEVATTLDALAAAGYYVDGPSVTAPDKTVLIDRVSGGNLRFTDAASQQQLSNIVGAGQGTYQQHDGLPDFSHLDPSGPGTGYASGATMTQALTGPLVTNRTWYSDANQTRKIYMVATTYTGPLATKTVRTTYDTSGNVLRTVTDAYTYNGPLMTGTTRTWV